jgi:hypothetical protein
MAPDAGDALTVAEESFDRKALAHLGASRRGRLN